jgi:hypothetical protein
VFHGRKLKLLLRAEVGEEAALAHPGRKREPADRERLEAFLGCELGGRRQDRVPGPLALRFPDGRSSRSGLHGRSIQLLLTE